MTSLRAAVIGVNWGGVHVSALRDAGVEVVALVGRDPDRTRDAAHRLGVPDVHDDVQPLWDLGLDLISVATPADTHVEVISQLPDVPVICEKPARGLSQAGTSVPARRSPIWVNYAFGFLESSLAAAQALGGLGQVREAAVVSRFELPHLDFGPEVIFMELVPHPWAWLATVLGPPRPAERLPSPAGVRLTTACGEVPLTLESRPEPGLGGIQHTVRIAAEQGDVVVSGAYRHGHPWRYTAHLAGAGGTRGIGPVEEGLPDPWYLANARSIGAVVAHLSGEGPGQLPMPWDDAVHIDESAKAALINASRGPRA